MCKPNTPIEDSILWSADQLVKYGLKMSACSGDTEGAIHTNDDPPQRIC